MESAPRLVRITTPLIVLAVSVVAGLIGIVLLAAAHEPVPIDVLISVASILSVTIVSAVAYYATEQVRAHKDRNTAKVLDRIMHVDERLNALGLQVLHIEEAVAFAEETRRRVAALSHVVDGLVGRLNTVELMRENTIVMPVIGRVKKAAIDGAEVVDPNVVDIVHGVARRLKES